jgi:hypothetical protein
MRDPEKMMKRILAILAIAILLPVAALAAKKKDQAQTGTDWLNAPTPDGSPTLKETSDWLAKTMEAYGGDNSNQPVTISGVRIDNSCNFYWTATVRDRSWNKYLNINDYSLALGAVTNVSAGDDNSGILIQTGQVEAVRLDNHGHYEHRTQNASNSGYFSVSRMPEAQAGGAVPQNPQQMVGRIVSALQHAVNLCQSAYKAPAETKEPF